MNAKANEKKIKLGSISKHLPPKASLGSLIQGRVNPELAEALRLKLKAEDVFIADWMEASIKAYLEETK